MKKFQFLVMLLMLAPFGLQAEDTLAADPVTKTLVWPDGTRYVGGVMAGKRTGKGTIFWQDGTRFVGQFENDMRNGPGTMILPDGTVYTGFFQDDELVDTESTIATSTRAAEELNNEESAAALQGTELPMEADSLGEKSSDTLAQVDENDLIKPAREAVIDPEPTIVLAEAPKTDEVNDTAPKTVVESDPIQPAEKENYYTGDVTDITDSVKEELIKTVDLWAAAWSDQNVPQYIANYAEDFVVPDRQSRRTWEALRRTRIQRPEYINLDVTYQRFELVDTNVVDVFFRQAYRSNTYSDLSDKVLRFRKGDTG